MEKTYSRAFKEAYVILRYLDKEEYRKIPRLTIRTIKKNMDLEYEYEINENFELDEQDMMPETRALLYNIYRDYLADEEEREEINKNQKNERIKNEKIKQKKYDPSILFEDKEKSKVIIPEPLQATINKDKDETNNHSLPVEIQATDEGVFIRIVNKIKKILKIK